MRRTLLVSLAGGLALATLAAMAAFFYDRPTVLKVTVARDGEDARLMAGIRDAFAKEGRNIRLKINFSSDAMASAEALQSGQSELAVVRSDIAMPASGQTVAILHRNAALLMALPGSKIDKVGALRGRRVAVLRAAATGQGNLNLLDVVLAQYDVPLDSVTKVPLLPGELPKAIKDGQIDAVLAVGVGASGNAGEAFAAIAQNSDGPPAFVPIAEAEALSQRSPAYESVEIPAGAFGGSPPRPQKSFETVGVTFRLVAHSSVKNAVAADLTRHLFAERLAVAQSVPLANKIEAPPTEKGQAFPVHPGTLEYLENEEQTFLEKNSDLIYLSAMLLSVIGSALAALASRMGPRVHSRVDAHLAQLLELSRQAREARDPGTLDMLERDADEALFAVLGADSLRGLDGQRAAAVGLAMDHLRAALSGRRDLLAHAGPPRLVLAGE